MILCIFAACVMFMARGTIERQKEEMDENNNMNISGKKDSSELERELSDIASIQKRTYRF